MMIEVTTRMTGMRARFREENEIEEQRGRIKATYVEQIMRWESIDKTHHQVGGRFLACILRKDGRMVIVEDFKVQDPEEAY